jgi:hypothetical protein
LPKRNMPKVYAGTEQATPSVSRGGYHLRR